MNPDAPLIFPQSKVSEVDFRAIVPLSRGDLKRESIVNEKGMQSVCKAPRTQKATGKGGFLEGGDGGNEARGGSLFNTNIHSRALTRLF